MATKIKVKTITHNGKFTNIVSSDDKKFSANNENDPKFKEVKDGAEIEVELKEWTNPKDNSVTTFISFPKAAGAGSKFPPKDVAWEKRKASLECAINAAKLTGTEVKSDKLLNLAETFHTYINQK